MYVRIVQAGAMKRHFRRPGADSLFCKDNSNILNPNRSSDHFCQQFIAFSHFKTSSFRLPAASLSFFCAIIHHRHSQKNVNPLPKCRTFFLSLQERVCARSSEKVFSGYSRELSLQKPCHITRLLSCGRCCGLGIGNHASTAAFSPVGEWLEVLCRLASKV